MDIAIGQLPFEEELLRRFQVTTVGRLHVPLPTPEDLIVLKAVANRPQDLADIAELQLLHGGDTNDR